MHRTLIQKKPIEISGHLTFQVNHISRDISGNLGIDFWRVFIEECFTVELNEADWRPCARNHEQQQRVWQLSAGPHTGVSPAGLCAQQDGEDCGSGSEQRRENRYGRARRLRERGGGNYTTVCYFSFLNTSYSSTARFSVGCWGLTIVYSYTRTSSLRNWSKYIWRQKLRLL